MRQLKLGFILLPLIAILICYDSFAHHDFGPFSSLDNQKKLAYIAEMVEDEEYHDAHRHFLAIDADTLNTEQLWRYSFLKASVALVQSQQTHALEQLKLPLQKDSKITDAPASWLKLYTHLNAKKQGFVQEAFALFSRYEQQEDVGAIQIWLALNQASRKQLQIALSDTQEDEDWQLWLEAANDYQQHRDMGIFIAQHPDHPVTSILTHTLNKTQDIALLLPVTGAFKEAGNALLDGFMSQHWQTPSMVRTKNIHIYDTTELTNSDINRQLSQNHDLIIGPLIKERVNSFNPPSNVPYLALNLITDTNDKLGIDLSIQQESIAIASQALKRGYRRVLLIQDDSIGSRNASKSFLAQLEDTEHIDVLVHTINNKDIRSPIEKLMEVDASQRRHRLLQKQLKTKLQYRARRRQDIDLIYITTQRSNTLLIRPMLDFFFASDIPTYITSRSYDITNPKLNNDLHNTYLLAPSWWLNQNLLQQTKSEYPKNIELYILGMETYHIRNAIGYFSTNKQYVYSGITGTIYRHNNHNNLEMQRHWLRVNNENLVDAKF